MATETAVLDIPKNMETDEQVEFDQKSEPEQTVELTEKITEKMESDNNEINKARVKTENQPEKSDSESETAMEPTSKAASKPTSNQTSPKTTPKRSKSPSNSSTTSESNQNPNNKSSSISPGGSAFAVSSGIGQSSQSTPENANLGSWFPNKVHDFLGLFNQNNYKEAKINFTSSEHGLQVNMFWPDKRCENEAVTQFNCFSQVAGKLENLAKFEPKYGNSVEDKSETANFIENNTFTSIKPDFSNLNNVGLLQTSESPKIGQPAVFITKGSTSSQIPSTSNLYKSLIKPVVIPNRGPQPVQCSPQVETIKNNQMKSLLNNYSGKAEFLNKDFLTKEFLSHKDFHKEFLQTGQNLQNIQQSLQQNLQNSQNSQNNQNNQNNQNIQSSIQNSLQSSIQNTLQSNQNAMNLGNSLNLHTQSNIDIQKLMNGFQEGLEAMQPPTKKSRQTSFMNENEQKPENSLIVQNTHNIQNTQNVHSIQNVQNFLNGQNAMALQNAQNTQFLQNALNQNNAQTNLLNTPTSHNTQSFNALEILENSPMRTNSPASGSEDKTGNSAPAFNATTALLNQIKNLGNGEKIGVQNPKVQPITLIKPQLVGNGSTGCIKDALEQLLSKKGVPEFASSPKPENQINLSNAANVVGDLLNKGGFNTATTTAVTAPISMSNGLTDLLSNVQNKTPITPGTTNSALALNGLNLTNLLSGGNNLFGNMNLLGANMSNFGNIMNPTANRTNSPISKSPNSKRDKHQHQHDDENNNSHSSHGDKNTAQQRRVPVRFTADQKRLLYQLFEVNRYPKKPEREEIAAKIGVPEYAVHNFFSNTRKAIYRAAAATPGGQASLSDLSNHPNMGDGIGLSDSLASLTAEVKSEQTED